ncbi:MAG: hypothetical protein ACRERD_17825, partial [Candidatus Binatia bacterium]
MMAKGIDDLARLVVTHSSRRTVFRAIAGLALGSNLVAASRNESGAHDLLVRCKKIKSKKKRKKCVKKARRHNAQHRA